MKTFLAVVVSLAVAASADAVVPAKVTIQGIANNRGNILVSLCTQQEFLHRCAQSRKVKAVRGSVEVSFLATPGASYAIMAMHDENGNNQLDRSSIGIPTEGFGFSRNATGQAGPPDFADAAVQIPASGGRFTVSMRY